MRGVLYPCMYSSICLTLLIGMVYSMPMCYARAHEDEDPRDRILFGSGISWDDYARLF